MNKALSIITFATCINNSVFKKLLVYFSSTIAVQL